MRKVISLLLFMALATLLSAQTISFAYDNAGNRIKREIVLSRSKISPKATAVCYNEMLSEKDIHIYPNPTKGLLKLEIRGFEDTDHCSINIFGMSGQQIMSLSVTSSVTEIDLSSRQNGVYVLLLTINGNDSTWKIIKN